MNPAVRFDAASPRFETIRARLVAAIDEADEITKRLAYRSPEHRITDRRQRSKMKARQRALEARIYSLDAELQKHTKQTMTAPMRDKRGFGQRAAELL